MENKEDADDLFDRLSVSEAKRKSSSIDQRPFF